MTNIGEERLVEFKGHVLTAPDTLAPATRILYAPSEGDNPTFRADVAACTGATVDYFDAISGTPDVALLSTYDCVLVWANYAFADNVLLGDNLAAYVDGGGKVILGQWCLPTAGNFLSGAIMGAAYCPITASAYESGTYNGDGTDCVHGGVATYESPYFDATTLIAGGFSDGTFNNPSNSLAVAWRADRMVYYSPGFTGETYSTGDWAQLTCNECECVGGGGGWGILYAPSQADSPTFRAEVAACSGKNVDYYDASAGTPTVAELMAYDCVFTWADFSYANPVLFGDNLAAYVDAGGKVILGQWTLQSDQANSLGGAIMTPAYCPVTTTTSYDSGAYDSDGTDCVHGGVSAYDTLYLDVATAIGGASSDGTFNNGPDSLAVAWRADRSVYYSPGNSGGTYGTGDWAQLLCNMCSCVDVIYADILYAPSEADNPTFRAEVAACSGLTVDYYDARVGTPDVALLSSYDCVLTWANSAYANNVLFGDNLAAYVDAGGKVILGQWCLPTAGNFLSGAIMTAAYCPTTGSFYEGGAYNGDGTDCVHGGVTSYESGSYFDVATLVIGASSDGTFSNPSNSLAVAWRADRMVYSNPGNTGGTYSTGQWAQLVCNMVNCP
jgi:hypothetical protein